MAPISGNSAGNSDDLVHNSRITVNKYADCNLDPQNLHSDHAWAILWDGVLIGHIPDALALCRYLMKNKLYIKN